MFHWKLKLFNPAAAPTAIFQSLGHSCVPNQIACFLVCYVWNQCGFCWSVAFQGGTIYALWFLMWGFMCLMCFAFRLLQNMQFALSATHASSMLLLLPPSLLLVTVRIQVGSVSPLTLSVWLCLVIATLMMLIFSQALPSIRHLFQAQQLAMSFNDFYGNTHLKKYFSLIFKYNICSSKI